MQHDRPDGNLSMGFDAPVALFLQASVWYFVSTLWMPKVCHVAMRRPVLGQHEDVSAFVAVGNHLVDGMPLEVHWASRQESDTNGACSGWNCADIQHGVPKLGRLIY